MTILRATLLVFTTVAASDMTGQWTLDLKPDFGGVEDSVACSFRQDDEMLAGNCGSGAPITGQVKDRKVTFYVKTGRRDEITVTFTGDLDDRASSVKGGWHFVENGKDHDGQFEMRKQ